MRRRCTSAGSPSYSTIAGLPVIDDPKVGPDSVLVRVKAVGVNPVDWKIVAGYLDRIMYVDFPFVPGWDVAGIVEAVGLDAPSSQSVTKPSAASAMMR